MSRTLLLAVITFLALSTAQTSALHCECTHCSETSTCEGDRCFYMIASIPGAGTTQVTRGCALSVFSQCNTSSDFHTTLCCADNDLCNQNLMADIGHTPGTVFLPTSQPSSSNSNPGPPILIPDTGLTTESDSTTPPPISVSPSCFHSDSSRSDIIDLCPLTAQCYSTLRLNSSGHIISRRGCAPAGCMDETRNKKVKRCCSAHLCNLELSIDTYFPGHNQDGSALEPTTSITPTETSTRPRIPPPILTPIASTTEAVPLTDIMPPENLYCHCDGENCIQNLVCEPSHACGIKYDINPATHHVTGYTRVCVADESKCESREEMEYTACCSSSLCNSEPEVEKIELLLLLSSNTPEVTEGPTSTTIPTLTPMEPPSDNEHDSSILISIAVLSIVACVLLVSVTIILVTCCIRQRRVRENFKLPVAATNGPHMMNNHRYHGNAMNNHSYHGNIYEKGNERASVQSSEMSSSSGPTEQSTPSKEQLMTSV